MKHWLITGVSSGFGRALARAALARGDRVTGSVRNEAAKASFESLAPDQAHGVLLDVTDEMAVRRVVAEVETAFGVIDVLVNNAGYGLIAAVEEASSAEIRMQFEVNVFGAVAMMQAVLPSMRARRGGRLVNISSVSGLVGWPSLGIYTGSKFALEGISETLAQELVDFNIRLILIEPGGFRTDFAGRSRAAAARQITDYETTAVGACKRTLDEHAGHERGDPDKAAQAILAVVDADEPPLRLLLGVDAVSYALGKLGTQQAEIGRWIELSTSTDFDT
jgi:NAD(P)-dependent dehydrogenase (short-subunit alcohol dehydrogenase family)